MTMATGRNPTKTIRAALQRLIAAGGTLSASAWKAGSSTVAISKAEGWITSEVRKATFRIPGSHAIFATETHHTLTDAGRTVAK